MTRRRSGEGTIFRAGNRWVARTSRPERRSFYGSTAAEARRKRDAYLAESRGISSASSELRWNEYAPIWLRSIALRRRRNTHDAYESANRLHIAPLIGTLKLGEIRPKHIQHVVDTAAKTYGRWLVVRIKSVLTLAFQALVDLEELSANPCGKVDMPKGQKRRAVAMDPKHASALMAYIRGHKHEALIRLYLGAGLRRGEALGLAWGSVDLDGGLITIRQAVIEESGAKVIAPTKTEGSEAVIPIGDDVVAALRDRRKRQLEDRLKAGALWQDTGLVFTDRLGGAIWPNLAGRIVKQIMAEAGLPPHYTIRTLRHTLATDMLGRGLDIKTVQYVLRHKRAVTTLDTYGHTPKDAAARAREAMNAAAREREDGE